MYVLLGLLLDQDLKKDHKKITDFKPPYVGGKYGGVTLLEDLGFVINPRLYPQSYHADTDDLPVFISAAVSKELEQFMDFVYSQRLYFPDKKLVIYNLDLTQVQIKRVSITIDYICFEIYSPLQNVPTCCGSVDQK